MNNNIPKPNRQDEKYNELKSALNRLERDISKLCDRKHSISQALKHYTTCEFCFKHFKKIKSNLSKTKVVKRSEEEVCTNPVCGDFDEYKFEKIKVIISYIPYICPYCGKPQETRENVIDYHKWC